GSLLTIGSSTIDYKESEEKRRAKTEKMIAQDWGTDEQSIRRRVDKRIKERAGFFQHLVSFLIAIPILLVIEPPIKNFLITNLPEWTPEDAAALISVVQQVPMTFLLLFPWMGGLIAHGLQVFYTSGGRLQARRHAQQRALVARYGEDWQETIDYKDYKRLRNRVEDRYKGRLGFMQHAVSAFFITLMGLTAWPALRDISIYFLETDAEAINFISSSAIPVMFVVIMLFSLLVHGIILGINIIAGDDAREHAVEQEIARERERSGLSEKAKRDQAKLKNEDLNVRLNDDGEFTESFISELENEPSQRTR
ncbi:MAG: 2TM domain-containing protein, partial [Chitinophagaceae bacterium]|nr:2TM domain-containing protein [Anaerolineae bacterium]